MEDLYVEGAEENIWVEEKGRVEIAEKIA
jgi:hypothetical protein